MNSSTTGTATPGFLTKCLIKRNHRPQTDTKHVTHRIFRRDDYRCSICGRGATDGVKLQIDHKRPVSKGGTDDESNLWTLCAHCNVSKSNLGLEKKR